MAYQQKNGNWTTKRMICPVTQKGMTKTFSTMDAALDFEQRAAQAQADGVALATLADSVLEDRTLYAVTRRMLREYYAFKTEATYATALGHLNRMCDYLGGQSLIQDVLDTRVITRMIEEVREKGQSVSYMNHFLQYFRRMNTSCVRWGYTTKEIDIPPSFKRERTRFEWCTMDEIEQLLQWMPKRYHPTVRFVNSTGLRIRCECMALTPEDIQDGRVRVLGKNVKLRYVPLSATALQALEDQAEVNERIPGKPIFRVPYSALCYALQVAGVRIGKKVTPHTLRHSFASRLAQKGMDIVKIQELMGHADITQTRRYMHLSPDWMTGVHNMLD